MYDRQTKRPLHAELQRRSHPHTRDAPKGHCQVVRPAKDCVGARSARSHFKVLVQQLHEERKNALPDADISRREHAKGVNRRSCDEGSARSNVGGEEGAVVSDVGENMELGRCPVMYWDTKEGGAPSGGNHLLTAHQGRHHRRKEAGVGRKARYGSHGALITRQRFHRLKVGSAKAQVGVRREVVGRAGKSGWVTQLVDTVLMSEKVREGCNR